METNLTKSLGRVLRTNSSQGKSKKETANAIGRMMLQEPITNVSGRAHQLLQDLFRQSLQIVQSLQHIDLYAAKSQAL